MQINAVFCSGYLSPPPISSSNFRLGTNNGTKSCTRITNPSSPSQIVCLHNSGKEHQRLVFWNTMKWSGGEISSFRGNKILCFPNRPAGTGDLGEHHRISREARLVVSADKSDSVAPAGEEIVPPRIGYGDHAGSALWVLGPIALISSLLLPQFFLSGVLEALIKDETLAEIVISLSSEVIFYIGLATYINVTEQVQQPHLELSQKRWGLITDHDSYLYSAYLTMGIKVFAPLFAAYLVWPVIGLPAVVAVVPFLLGIAAQYVIQENLYKRSSSCWPLLTIIFEVYRLYQLNRGAHFVERLMFLMRKSAMSRELLERSSALFSLVTVFQGLGIVCLWSLIAFLLRLVPSKPVPVDVQ